MRMGVRRFNRLTNAFRKKIDNHVHALSLDSVHYNFARIHTSSACVAMAVGRTDKPWSMADVGALIDAREPYEKRAA